ncbi:ABC transporter ATP-binding protein [Agrococcus jejuensis]|uniref:Oligopeptide/dipeptide transporter, C-terminal region n=1 Tax=Agrococcus jejuensis TaxID=399736 RepID=A0A1G8ENE7_9MICO|nr:ABC transporter ATP-binding protein [Agrococcus jejuensis]SDH71401.1 Oligopeptide/dipeptide transporter, C-terminal region [Agrococcus jejuensis]
MSGDSVLQVRDLDVHLGRGTARQHVIRGATFRLRPGEAVGLIGETGSGKSTIARAILGLVRPSGGSVQVDGHELVQRSARAWRRLRREGAVQYVFQDPLRSLDPDHRVGDSVGEPLRIRGVASAEVRERVAEELRRVNLDPALADRFPSELSGGQRQRIAIARALITRPRVLILDEPVSALDSANRVAVLRLLEQLRASDVTLLFISHDLGSVAGVTDRTLVLHEGRIVEDGPTSRVVNAPAHPYTRLLIGSAPTLRSGAIDAEERALLRAELAASEG